MMLNSISVGSKIAEARKSRNLSQAHLAQQISISPQAVGKWERGESLPDVKTLTRLAEIFGVDLNYFSDNFQSSETSVNAKASAPSEETGKSVKQKKKFDWNLNMSEGNWVDADFSGLKNLAEQFSASNIKNCKFLNADLSDITFENNNIEKCDFSFSDMRNSKIQSSNLLQDNFSKCSFIDTTFIKNNIGQCNYSGADFSGAEFRDGYFESNNVANAVWKFTSFNDMGISDVIFNGSIEDCRFENCAFYNVKFQDAMLTNTFFKYNRKFKKVQFINCKADSITYAFLKNNQADLTGITLFD